VLVLLVAIVPGLAKKEKQIVQLLNEQPGKTEEQMGDWSRGSSIEHLLDGRKRLANFREAVRTATLEAKGLPPKQD